MWRYSVLVGKICNNILLHQYKTTTENKWSWKEVAKRLMSISVVRHNNTMLTYIFEDHCDSWTHPIIYLLTLIFTPPCVGNDHSNRNKISSAQTSKIKYARSSKNILSYAHIFITGHGRWISDFWDGCQRGVWHPERQWSRWAMLYRIMGWSIDHLSF